MAVEEALAESATAGAEEAPAGTGPAEATDVPPATDADAPTATTTAATNGVPREEREPAGTRGRSR
jgi:hypothetical protein